MSGTSMDSDVKVEVSAAAPVWGTSKRMGRADKISVFALHSAASKHPDAQQLMSRLEDIDRNGDGDLDAGEVIMLLKDIAALKRDKKYLIWGIVAALAFSVMMVAAIVGLTAVVVIKTRDTEVAGSTLVVKSNGAVVQVANTDMAVVDGMLVSRTSENNQTLGVSYSRTVSTSLATLNETNLGQLSKIYIYPNGDSHYVALNILAATYVPATSAQPASFLYVTAMGTLRLAQADGTLLNKEVLEFLEKNHVPTCRNPSGNGQVMSGASPCDILTSPEQKRRRLLKACKKAKKEKKNEPVFVTQDITYNGVPRSPIFGVTR